MTKWYEQTDDPCGTTSLPWASASAEILSNSVTPPHQPTSGWMMSQQPISISMPKPQRVASCSPVVTSDPMGAFRFQLGIAPIIVGAQRLLDPLEAALVPCTPSQAWSHNR